MSRAIKPSKIWPPQRDWQSLQYQPSPNTPLLACKCGAKWLDDKPGRDAHRVVFGHDPEAAS